MRAAKILTLLSLLYYGGTASAQITTGNNPSGYANQGAFNRNNQPLSPYLNLLRGNNNAVNYYYGVRGGGAPFGFTGMFNPNSQGVRQTFFPIVDNLSELSDDPNASRGVMPTGHPVGFSNTLGYFGGGPMMGGNRQQQSPFLKQKK